MERPTATYCRPKPTSTEKAPICSTATATITGTSPRRGTISWPRSSSATNNVTVAIPERIVTDHSGDTLCTRVFVTTQFSPQATTTNANSSNAVRRERKCGVIVRSLSGARGTRQAIHPRIYWPSLKIHFTKYD